MNKNIVLVISINIIFSSDCLTDKYLCPYNGCTYMSTSDSVTDTDTKGNVNLKTGNDSFLCSETVLLSNLILTLFTQNNIQQGTVLTQETLNQVNPRHFTTIIIHGYTGNANLAFIQAMKNAYLNKAPHNIIIVDWSYYAFGLYTKAVCAVPQVGTFVGDLIYNLTQIELNVKKLQLNGFSLGAHISGFAGNRVYNLTQTKISRINGLDAAGPEYIGAPISERLDATDADVVQGIHTNGGAYGYSPNYGSIDFQVNFVPGVGCGSSQNGCPLNPGVPITGIITPYYYCDHVRSVAYFIESINSNNFIGRQCQSCTHFELGLCRNSKIKTVMGENCPLNETGVRYLSINFKAPFAES